MSSKPVVLVESAPKDAYHPHALIQHHGCPFAITALVPLPSGQVQVVGQRISA